MLTTRSLTRYPEQQLALPTSAPSRYQPSRTAKKFIGRPLLIEHLDDVRTAPLAMVCAPAGYGKSILLAQHYDALIANGARAAWITLNPTHQDIFNFYASLTTAIVSCGVPIAAPPIATPLARSLNAEVMVGHFEASLGHIDHDIFVYLDDAHQLAQAESLGLLVMLVERSLPRLHLIIASRRRLKLPLARLRQRDMLVELGTEDLQFDLPHANALFSEGNPANISDALIAKLHDRCEGWAGGLALAAKLLRNCADAQKFLDSFTGERRQLVDFFREEVTPLCPREDDVVSFLLCTSVVGRMSATLCDELTGRNDGKEMLEHCESVGMFIVGLDEERKWYRYHHLFAEYMRRQLNDEFPDLALQLHLRAGEWLFANNYFVDAFNHTVTAGNLLRAAEMLDHWCEHEFGSQASVDIITLAARLPDNIKTQFPRIMLIEAWRRDVFWQFEGSRELVELSRERLQQMERDSDTKPEELQAIKGLLVHGEMMIACCSDDMPKTEALSHILIRDYERANLHVRGSFYTSLLYAQREQYKLNDIDRLSRLGRSHYHRPGKGLTSVFHEAVVGPTQFMAGRTEVAIDCLEDALETAVAISGKGSMVAAIVALPLSEIRYERNELDLARQLLDNYLPHVSAHGFIDQMIAAWMTQAKLLRRDGNTVEAYKVIDAAVTFSREHAFDRVRINMAAIHIKFLLGDGKVDEAIRIGRLHGISGAAKAYLPGGMVTTRHEALALSWVRLAIAENRIAEAMMVAKQWHSFVETAGAVRSVIRWDILLSHCLMLSGEGRAAQRALRRGINVAAGGSFIRSFLDEGPWLQSLLQELGTSTGACGQFTDTFAAKLFAEFVKSSDRASIRVEIPTETGSGVYGALGTREMEILRLMGTGMLNREIGEKLGMTEGSVKWYVQQIYDKIGVRRRAQVVERAYQLGLISN